MQQSDSSTELPTEFLVSLGKLLQASSDTDLQLAEILAQQILTAEPAKDCVEQAFLEIEALAAARANTTKGGSNV